MQEEINHKTITVYIKGAKVTANSLKAALRAVLRAKEKYTVYFNGEAPSRVRTYADPADATNDFKDGEFEAVLADYNTSVEINL